MSFIKKIIFVKFSISMFIRHKKKTAPFPEPFSFFIKIKLNQSISTFRAYRRACHRP